VVFPIYNLIQFGNYKNRLISGWVQSSGRVNRTRFMPVLKTPTATHPSATRIRGLQRAPLVMHSGSMPTSVADLRDPSRPSLSPPPIRATGWWGYFPLSPFLPPHQGENHCHSPPVSCRTTPPIGNSFRPSTPHTRALLLPQDSSTSGKNSGLHRASRR
jgi:hypothetical protein